MICYCRFSVVCHVQMWCHGIWRSSVQLALPFSLLLWALHRPHLHLFRRCVVSCAWYCLHCCIYISSFLFLFDWRCTASFKCGVLESGKALYSFNCRFLFCCGLFIGHACTCLGDVLSAVHCIACIAVCLCLVLYF